MDTAAPGPLASKRSLRQHFLVKRLLQRPRLFLFVQDEAAFEQMLVERHEILVLLVQLALFALLQRVEDVDAERHEQVEDERALHEPKQAVEEGAGAGI